MDYSPEKIRRVNGFDPDKTPGYGVVTPQDLEKIRLAVLNKNLLAVMRLVEVLIYQIRNGLISEGSAKLKMFRLLELIIFFGFSHLGRIQDLLSELQLAFFAKFKYKLNLLADLKTMLTKSVKVDLPDEKIKAIVDLVMETFLQGEDTTTISPQKVDDLKKIVDQHVEGYLAKAELNTLGVKQVTPRAVKVRSIEAAFFAVGAFSIPRKLILDDDADEDDDETPRVRTPLL